MSELCAQCNGFLNCRKCGEIGSQLSVPSCLLPLAFCLLPVPYSLLPTPYSQLE
ncbi:MAG: hypothetical protein F6K02_16590 [Moorea sp. SIO3A5]|nr:hypothetical protein [Moorena sp. SIO3A5]